MITCILDTLIGSYMSSCGDQRLTRIHDDIAIIRSTWKPEETWLSVSGATMRRIDDVYFALPTNQTELSRISLQVARDLSFDHITLCRTRRGVLYRAVYDV